MTSIESPSPGTGGLDGSGIGRDTATAAVVGGGAGPAEGDSHETPGITAVGLSAGAGSLLCWTVTPLLVAMLTAHFDLWASNGWRYGMAALMWLPFLLRRIAGGEVPRSLWRRALIPAAFSAGAQVAFVAAFYFTGPAMLTFGLRMQIVATAIGAAVLFPAERAVIRRPAFLIGAAAVLAGVVGVASLAPAREPAAESAGSNLIGMLLAAVAGVGYAAYAMAVRKCLAGVGARLSFSIISLYVGAAMLLLMVLFGEAPVAQLAAIGPGIWLVMILSVVFGLAAGHVIYFIALVRLGIAPATGIVQLQPFTVAAASYFLFGELLTAGQTLLGTLAVAGAATMLFTQHAVASRRRVDPRREFDTLPVDETVAFEEAELAGSPESKTTPAAAEQGRIATGKGTA